MSQISPGEIANWTANEFSPHVEHMIQQLRVGELFTACGLTEEDAIILDDEKPPPRSDKVHKFNILLEAVATKLVKENGLEKRMRKGITKQLHKFSADWADAIRRNPPKGSLSQHTRDSHVDERDGETMSVEDTPAADAEESREMSPPRHRELSQRQLEQKKIFESERDEILSDIPDDIKSRFGQIMFSKWSNNYLPVLVLSPFQVPPGGVRDMWYTMYDKVKSGNRLQNMTNLVYWYGAFDDPPNAYSFLATKKLIPYDAGVKKGYDQVPKARKKRGNDQLVRGLEEMKQDLMKRPEDRSGLMGADFLEVYLLSSDSEDEPESMPDLKVPKKRGRKKKKEEMGDEREELMEQPKKKPGRKRKQSDSGVKVQTNREGGQHKKKAKIDKKSVDELGTVAQQIIEESPQQQPTLQSMPVQEPAAAHEEDASLPPDPQSRPEIDEYAEEEISSHDDKDDEDVEPESESDDDDAEFTLNTSKPKRKKKGGESKQPTRKKVTKAKDKKKEREEPEKSTKTHSQAKLKRMEQRSFEECEQNFLPTIRRWERALETQDARTLDELYEDILAVVNELSAPFIEAYDVPKLIKKSKQVRDTPSRKTLFESLKKSYTTKKSEVPVGFTPKKQKTKQQPKRNDMAGEVAKHPPVKQGNEEKNPTIDDLQPEDPLAAKECINKAPDDKEKPPSQKSLDEVVSPSIKRNEIIEIAAVPEQDTGAGLSQKKGTPVKTERKKKFSLGSLMRPTTSAPKLPSKGTQTKQTPDSGQLVQTRKLPTWILQPPNNSPSDEDRLYALEFFRQAAPYIPRSTNLNHDAIALGLEAAVYEWADAEGQDRTNWLDRYWVKVHSVVACITGKRGEPGTIAGLIAEGRFKSPIEIVALSDEVYADSFEGRPVKI